MEALLSLVPPQQLPASPFISFGEATIACPILLILPRHLELAAELAARAAAEALPPDCLRSRLEWAVCCMLQLPRPPFGILLESGMPHLPAVKQAYRALAPRLAELQAHALRLLDRVYAAGYRVRVYIGVC